MILKETVYKWESLSSETITLLRGTKKMLFGKFVSKLESVEVVLV